MSNAISNKVKLNDLVSVKDFGAIGDGVTDDTAAINAAAASGAGRIYYPTPSVAYLVTEIIPASNQTHYGDGTATIIKQKVTIQFKYVFSIFQKTGVTIEKLQIDGNGNAQPTGEHMHGISIRDSTDVIVRDVTVHDCNGDSIYIASSSNSILTNRISVTGCNVYNLGRQGICVAEYGARDIIISNNRGQVGTLVTTSSSRGNVIHLEIDNQPTVWVGNVVIGENDVTNSTISIGGSYVGISIDGNVLRHDSGTIIDLGYIVANAVSDVVISNNTVIGDNSSNVDGIYIQDPGVSGAAFVKNIVINGNVISRVAGHGINLLGTSFGVPTLGLVSVSNNIIQNIGTGLVKNGILVATPFPSLVITGNAIKTVTNIGIVVQGSSNFIVSSNHVADWAATYGIYFAANSGVGAGPGVVSGNFVSHVSPTGKTGIFVENNALNTRITVTGNDCSKTATPIAFGALTTNCTAVVNTNASVAPTGSFTLSAAATTTVANANTMPYSNIVFVPTNAAAATLMGSVKALYVSAKTQSTSFAVSTANAAAAAGTETFNYWIA